MATKKNTVKALMATAVGVAGLGMGIWCLEPSVPAPPSAERPLVARVARPTHLPTGSTTRPFSGSAPAEFGVGQVAEHLIEACQVLELGGRAASTAGETRLCLHGRLQLTPMQADAGADPGPRRLAARFVDATLRTHDPAGADALLPAPLSAGIERAFWLALDAEGAIEQVGTSPDAAVLSQSVQRAVASLLQVPAGERVRAELDPTGRCEVRYTPTPAGWQRQCQDYLALHTPSGEQPPAHLGTFRPSGAAQLTLDDHHWIISLHADQQVDGTVLDGAMTVSSAFRATVGARHVLADRDLAAQIVQEAAQLPPSGWVAQSDTSRAARPVPSIVASIPGAPDDQARGALRTELEAALRQDDSAAWSLAERAKSADDDEAAILLGGLGSAGTPQTQAALLSVAGDAAVPTERRRDALAVSALLETPTDASLGALHDLAHTAADDEVADSARLALGANVGRAAGEPAQRGWDKLVAGLQDTDGTEEHLDWMAALGNTGAEELLDVLQSDLQSPDPAVRAQAVWAIRLVPLADVDMLLSVAMVRDSEPTVRAAALRVATLRPLAPLAAALHRVLNAEPEADLRLAAVQLVGPRMDEVPQLLPALLWNATHDPADTVRDEAAVYAAVYATPQGPVQK